MPRLVSSPSKILIIRLSSIGDIILTTPVIRALRRSFPNARIDYLVAREYRELLDDHPAISNLLILDKTLGNTGLRSLQEQIRRAGYEVIIDLHRNLRSGRLTHFPGRPPILAFRKQVIKRFLWVQFKINRYGKVESVPERYLNTLKPLGIEGESPAPELPLPDELVARARQHWQALREQSVRIVIAPGARHFTKRWPAEYYLKLIKYIYRRHGWKCLLVGGASEQELCTEIANQAVNEAVANLAGKFSLMETIALISTAHFFISNDSGLMHAAAAFQIPQIAIFGSTTRELGFFPVNPKAVVVENPEIPCRPCSHIGKATCPRGHFDCMKSLTPERLSAVFNQLVGQYPPDRGATF